MNAVQGTPVTINGKSGAPTGQPGPAPSTSALRVQVPMPPGRKLGGTPIAPATTFARYLRISNTDAANSLLVSFFDDNQVTITKGTSQEFYGEFPFFSVQSSATTCQWEAYAVVAA
jgi:hypothetical protein